MQAALEDRLPRGARVQMLDSDYGAFLAMARAGMRQATPHIQWFSLMFAEDSVRREFLAALEDNPPAAVLLTNSQWPQPDGFDAADRWPKFAALLASRYVLDRSKNENGIAWRLYLRRARAVSAIAPTPKAFSSTPLDLIEGRRTEGACDPCRHRSPTRPACPEVATLVSLVAVLAE
jgi:hypothetical protein